MTLIKDKHQLILFIAILLILFFFLDYHKIFFLFPQGIHFMRQTDSLSFASQYFENGFNFFEPQLFNLKNTDGKAACEFPIIYFVSSIIYLAVGKQFYLLKLLHLIIIYIGVFLIFKMLYDFLKDWIYAALISLFLFTSTVFNYYSFNYLPDAAALGFTFIGIYYFHKYLSKSENKTGFSSQLFFTLASLIKVTFLIYPIASLLFLVSQFYFSKRENSIQYIKKTLVYGTIGILFVLFWNAYMIYYNYINNSASFLTTYTPIWNLEQNTILIVWNHISNYWYNSYFARSAYYFLFAIVIFQLFAFYKTDKNLTIILIILFFGSLIYFILFYSQFENHDYYFMLFIPFIILLFANGIKTVIVLTRKKIIHFIFKIVFFAIVAKGINLSRIMLNQRYLNGKNEHSHIGFVIQKNKKEIEKIKLPKNAKFIVAPDLTQNGALLFLDRMGWNIENTKDLNGQKIGTLKQLGATYLLLADDSKQALDICKSNGKLILEGDGMYIFKLK